METKRLREKIDRFSDQIKEGKLNIKFFKEIIIDMNTWLDSVENILSNLEFEQIEKDFEILKLQETIEYLQKALILTGHTEILTVASIMDKDNFNKAIDFLLDNKDRLNASNLYQIGILLRLSQQEGKNIKSLVEFVNYARTGT